MKSKLRGYAVSFKDDEYSYAVAARNAKEAKTIGWQEMEREYGTYELGAFLDLRVKWIRGADTTDLKVGPMWDEPNEALCRGFYAYIEEGDCDWCETIATLIRHTDKDGKHHALCCSCNPDGEEAYPQWLM